jgi:predicted esterase
MILLHGRGDSAEGILRLAVALDHGGFSYVAPQAAGNTWYPLSFLAPMDQNQPWLDSALEAVGAAIETVERAGVPADRVIILGFSQGACLGSEYVARNPRVYGGLVALSGGLIGPDGTARDYPGELGGTEVFLGCDDRDPHIPRARVDETEAVLGRMGARVTKRIYTGLGHGVNEDELGFVRRLMSGLLEFGE